VGVPVEVPGLATIVPEVAGGTIVIVESGADGAKSFLVRTLARTALRQGDRVTYLTSRDSSDVQHMLLDGGAPTPPPPERLAVQELDALPDWHAIGAAAGILAIDSFSFLTLDMSAPALATMMRTFRTQCHASGLTVILATDRGMFEPRNEAIAVHLSDGLIQFHTKEGPEGLVRYLRIPKWSEGTLTDRNVYYEFDGKHMAIDLRRRVL
jgi:KaiC/GvpD/RAD55 family RecA-like ATPase